MQHKGVRRHHVESDILKEGPGTETMIALCYASVLRADYSTIYCFVRYVPT